MEHYEEFKTKVYQMTTIDLSAYKEKQMKRRIDSLVTRNKCDSYDAYVKLLTSDKSTSLRLMSLNSTVIRISGNS